MRRALKLQMEKTISRIAAFVDLLSQPPIDRASQVRRSSPELEEIATLARDLGLAQAAVRTQILCEPVPA